MDSNKQKLDPPCGEPTSGEGDFGWALGMLLRSYYAYAESVIVDIPHGLRGYQVLSTVVHGNQPNQLSIATHLGIDRTVMTYLIDDLVASGLVERQQDPSDRRARKIVGTEIGARTLHALDQRVREAEQKVLGGLNLEEQRQFRILINRIALSVRQISPETDPCEIAAGLLDDGASISVT